MNIVRTTIAIDAAISAASEGTGSEGFALEDVVQHARRQMGCAGLDEKTVRALAWLRLDGQPILDGMAGTLQRLDVAHRLGEKPEPTAEEYLAAIGREHPKAPLQDVKAELRAHAQFLRQQGDRYIEEAAALREVLAARRAAR